MLQRQKITTKLHFLELRELFSFASGEDARFSDIYVKGPL